MNMQSQLQAAIAAAEKTANEAITKIERTQPLDDREKNFIRKHEALHAEYQTTGEIQEDDSSVASPAPGAANHDGASSTKIQKNNSEPVRIDTSGNVGIGTGNDDDDQPNWQPVADVVVPIVSKAVKIKNLDEKAVLVQVNRRMYSPYLHDKEESIKFGAGNVTKHLFEGSDNIVKETNAVFGALYKYVNDMTVPWATGVRLLNANLYMEFSTELRKHVDDANSAVDKLAANWDTAVQIDYNRMLRIAQAKGKPNLANINDYPDVQTLRSKYGVDVQYMPVPTADGFDPRLGMSAADQASVQDRVNDAEANGAKYVINQMLDPMSNAVEKLRVNIGDKGSFFRDSLIDNMVKVADRMGRINISDDPVVTERIKDLRSLVGTYANNKDVLRNSQSVRSKAATQIDNLVGQMAGLV